jgi:AcrR family transcriptional regulator
LSIFHLTLRNRTVQVSDESPQYYIHKPKQARSAERYAHILDTAERLFVREGYAQVGTNQIAAEAGVSVGSVYRFFSGKDALTDALVERFVDGLREVLPTPIDPQHEPMPAVVGRMLGGIFAFSDQHPAMGHVLSADPNGALGRGMIRMHLEIEGWVAAMLGAYHPTLSEAARRLCAAGGMGIVKGMMSMSQPPDHVPFAIVLDEMLLALMAYVEASVRRAG